MISIFGCGGGGDSEGLTKLQNLNSVVDKPSAQIQCSVRGSPHSFSDAFLLAS